MKVDGKSWYAFVIMLLCATSAIAADRYQATINLFKNAGESRKFLAESYGYAVIPTIGEAGLGIGGAHGKGRVYERGRLVGNVTMNQLSIGFQAGGKAYSEIIFFQNRDAFNEFTSGNFEFGADVSAVAITAAVNAEVNTAGGTSAGASGGKHDATTVGGYRHGLAVFTIAKGGLMYQAALEGQKFSYRKRAR
ncbi:MAG: lipid-binding SYLF domain-containing protein [Pseudomonadales bacterium]|mgnify:CR=1 FL=1|nr:lipid-binding SYLF domain-containing protein [Pseudomonadales bacterium]